MELVVVMGLMSATASLAVVFLVDLMRLGWRHARWAGLTGKSFQLAECLREDLAGARAVAVEDGVLVVERRDGATVTYVLRAGRLQQVVCLDGEETPGAFAPCSEVSWQVLDQGKLVRGDLVLRAEGAGKVVPTFPVAIAASTGTGGGP